MLGSQVHVHSEQVPATVCCHSISNHIISRVNFSSPRKMSFLSTAPYDFTGGSWEFFHTIFGDGNMTTWRTYWLVFWRYQVRVSVKSPSTLTENVSGSLRSFKQDCKKSIRRQRLSFESFPVHHLPVVLPSNLYSLKQWQCNKINHKINIIQPLIYRSFTNTSCKMFIHRITYSLFLHRIDTSIPQ
jgi:hypothetical protein